MVDNLEKFLSQAVGNKYGLSGNKMMRRESVRFDQVDDKG